MRTIKLLGLALLATLSLTALAATAAHAALPEVKPEKAFPATFTGVSGAGTLETLSKEQVICKEDTLKGEFTNAKEGVVTVDFKKCTALGFATNSLPDAAETILLDKAAILLCYINHATLDVGVVVHIPGTLHLEIPVLTGVLINITGWAIGLLEPVNKATNTFKLNFAQKAGEQEAKKCEGGKEEILLASKDAEHLKPEAAGELSVETITTAQNITIVE